jgi:hypothetical protein
MLDNNQGRGRRPHRRTDGREAEGLLTTKQAAAYIGSTENSLRCMRSKGYGPTFLKIGAAVFYRKSELHAYQGSVGPSSRTARLAAEKERGAPGSTRMRP